MKLRRTRNRFTYAGRVVVITGGSRGLGFLMAGELRKQGARVALLARNREELRHAKEQLGGGNILTVPCDVGVRGDVRQAIEIVMQHFGRIDMLINNAGVIQVGPLEHMTYERLPSRDERALLGRAALHRGGASDHAPAAVGPHHQHRVDRGPHCRAAPRAVCREQVRAGRILRCRSRRSREVRHSCHDGVPGADANRLGCQRARQRPARSRVRLVRRTQLSAVCFDRCAAGSTEDRRGRASRRSAPDDYAAGARCGHSRSDDAAYVCASDDGGRARSCPGPPATLETRHGPGAKRGLRRCRAWSRSSAIARRSATTSS